MPRKTFQHLSNPAMRLFYVIAGVLGVFALIALVFLGSIILPLMGDDFTFGIILLGGVLVVMGVIWIVIRRAQRTPQD